MRIQLVVSDKDALFSSIRLLFRKNSFHHFSFYLCGIISFIQLPFIQYSFYRFSCYLCSIVFITL